MKKANFIICLAFAVLSVTIANAQPRYGITAGYSLNNEVLKARNASPEISGGINHGFYVGGQFEYQFGELFSLQTGLQFRRYGTTIRGDVNKVLDNINSTVKGLHAFSPGVIIEDKGWDPEHLTDEQKEELDDPLRLGRVPLKNVRASYSLYAIYLPLTAKLSVGNKVSLLAGVNFNYTVIADIKFSARMKDGTIIDQEAEQLKQTLPEISNAFSGTEYEEDDTMTLNEFYKKEISNPFTIGGHIGIEYTITKNIDLSLIYNRGFMSNVRKPFTKTGSLTNRALSLGITYSF